MNTKLAREAEAYINDLMQRTGRVAALETALAHCDEVHREAGGDLEAAAIERDTATRAHAASAIESVLRTVEAQGARLVAVETAIAARAAADTDEAVAALSHVTNPPTTADAEAAETANRG